MEQRIRLFKRALQREMPSRGPGRRFSPRLVAEAVSLAMDAQRVNWSLPELARELGVGVATLKRWCDREQEAERHPAKLQPVAVVPHPGELALGVAELVVHGPAAMRIEGLGLDELVALWRQLS